MKVRNIAFFGVMASILGVGYANADTTPATVIASKAYADTKEATANKADATTRAQWEAITNRTTKFPTVNAVDAALSDISTTVAGILTGTESTSDTSHALTNARTTTLLNTKQPILDATAGTGNVSVTGDGNAITTVATDGNGGVTFTKGTTFLTSSDISGKADKQTVTDNSSAATSLVTVNNDGVVTAKQSAGAAALKGVVTTMSTATEGNDAATDANVPTELAVATALANGLSGKVNTSDVTSSYSATGTAPITGTGVAAALATLGNAATQDVVSTYSATGTAPINGTGVADALATLGNAATQDVVSTYASDGTAPINGTGVAAALGTLDSNVTATNQVFTKIAIVDGKLDEATSVKSGVTSAMITDGTIVNDDVAANAAILYSKMNNALKEINSSSGTAACNAANPCVLSYIGDGKFKWTNMETDGLSAVADANN